MPADKRFIVSVLPLDGAHALGGKNVAAGQPSVTVAVQTLPPVAGVIGTITVTFASSALAAGTHTATLSCLWVMSPLPRPSSQPARLHLTAAPGKATLSG